MRKCDCHGREKCPRAEAWGLSRVIEISAKQFFAGGGFTFNDVTNRKLAAFLTSKDPPPDGWEAISIESNSEIRQMAVWFDDENRYYPLVIGHVFKRRFQQFRVDPLGDAPRLNFFSSIMDTVPVCPQIIRLRLWPVCPDFDEYSYQKGISITQQIETQLVVGPATGLIVGNVMALYIPGAESIMMYGNNNNNANPAPTTLTLNITRAESNPLDNLPPVTTIDSPTVAPLDTLIIAAAAQTTYQYGATVNLDAGCNAVAIKNAVTIGLGTYKFKVGCFVKFEANA